MRRQTALIGRASCTTGEEPTHRLAESMVCQLVTEGRRRHSERPCTSVDEGRSVRAWQAHVVHVHQTGRQADRDFENSFEATGNSVLWPVELAYLEESAAPDRSGEAVGLILGQDWCSAGAALSRRGIPRERRTGHALRVCRDRPAARRIPQRLLRESSWHVGILGRRGRGVPR